MAFTRTPRQHIVLLFQQRVGLIALATLTLHTTALAQTQFISTIGDQTGNIGLYKQVDKDNFTQVAIVEIKGSIEFGSAGIMKGGENAFLRLQTTDAPDKWLNIVKKELVNGRVIITTEDKKVYTIYDLQGNYVGKIASGRTDAGKKK